MSTMTAEEFNALDEHWTKATPQIKFAQPTIFSRQRALLDVLDKASANYIIAQAEASSQTPVEIINKIVQKEITTAI